jgi:hypothetical protein
VLLLAFFGLHYYSRCNDFFPAWLVYIKCPKSHERTPTFIVQFHFLFKLPRFLQRIICLYVKAEKVSVKEMTPLRVIHLLNDLSNNLFFFVYDVLYKLFSGPFHDYLLINLFNYKFHSRNTKNQQN